jgi:hypothetical protein
MRYKLYFVGAPPVCGAVQDRFTVAMSLYSYVTLLFSNDCN